MSSLFCYRMMLYQGFRALPLLLSKNATANTLGGTKKMLRLS